jgi:phosphopantetheinyl transferase
VLAAAWGVNPGLVTIEHDELGKPRVVAPEAMRTWSVSSSHSEGVAVLAWSRARTVGVDVAACDPNHARPEAARVFMTPHEFERWSGSGLQDRVGHFYRIWARKEATLKALGTGFATDARSVDVEGTHVVHGGRLGLMAVDVPFRDGWVCAVAGSDESG